MRRLPRLAALAVAIALLAGCAAGRAFRRGEDRARVGDWDAAVTYYRQALQADPDRAEYRIAYERATLNASRVHFDAARQLEAKDQLEAALLEYRRTIEFDPGNRQAVERIVQLEQIVRDRAEASRPKSRIEQLREIAQKTPAAPLLNPASRAPIDINFAAGTPVRDILNFLGNASGINITYDTSFQDRPGGLPAPVHLVGTLEQVLHNVLSSNNMFYTVVDDKTIVVAVDTPATRQRYERQVALTIPISYADAAEIQQMLTQITRVTGGLTPPIIISSKTANTITVRGTQPMIDVIRELVRVNDKPRAEVTLEVEVLEVNRTRVKELGLNLSNHQVNTIFSPEQVPSDTTPPFNLNTISQGISTADFYLSVPQAIVRFLATDTRTRVLAQTTLRGAEGSQLTLNIGGREPYLQTTFAPIAAGGANTNPLSSYSFEQVGITVEATPRVTDEGDILLTLLLRNTALGPSRTVGGSPAPSFTNREVRSNVRLRDGESHMLAGLLQDEERRSMRGFPGIVSLPVLKDLFSQNDSTIAQTDIVMLVTPRIIRTHEYTARDLSPIYLGTNQNLGLTGPPPLIAAQPDTEPAVGPPVQGVPPQGVPAPTAPPTGPPGLVTTQPPGTSPIVEPQRDLTAPSPTATTLKPAAQVSLTPPAGDVRVGAGPYMVPLYINSVSRASTISVTVNFNPAVLRVRSVQESGFLKQGGFNVVFTPKIDSAAGRIDLAFARTGDTTGASGSGLLAGIQFDAIGTGATQLTVSGVATDPQGTVIPLQFAPATVVVR